MNGDDDSGKFEEYRDPHEGVFGAGDLLLEDPDRRRYLRFGGFDLGEEDADYFLEGGRWGTGASARLLLPAPAQLQQPRAHALPRDRGRRPVPAVPAAGRRGDLRVVRHRCARDAELGFETAKGRRRVVQAHARVELRGRLSHHRSRRPPPGHALLRVQQLRALPEPVDEKIHEATADAPSQRLVQRRPELHRELLRERLPLDPGRRTPRRSRVARSVGAIAAEPDNSAHLVRSRARRCCRRASPSKSRARSPTASNFQDERFVPMTVNPTLAPAPLPANDLNGDVRPLLANVLLTARPLPKVDVRGRYRLHDYDNQSDEILFTQTSVSDAELTDETKRSFAPSYTTQNASIETSYRITSATKATLAFAWDRWNRGPEREVRETDEYTPELRLDTRAGRWANLPPSYSYSVRDGNGYDELAPFVQVEPGVPRRRSPRRSASTPRPTTPHGPPPVAALRARGHRHHVDRRLPPDQVGQSLRDGLQRRFDVGVEATHRPFPQVEITTYYTYDWIELKQRSASSGGTLEWRSTTRTAPTRAAWTSPSRSCPTGSSSDRLLHPEREGRRTHGRRPPTPSTSPTSTTRSRRCLANFGIATTRPDLRGSLPLRTLRSKGLAVRRPRRDSRHQHRRRPAPARHERRRLPEQRSRDYNTNFFSVSAVLEF